MRKYAITEQSKVLSPEEHEAMEAELKKLGKTSAVNLTSDEREKVQRALDNA